MRFGLGRSFDAANPLWQDYISGISGLVRAEDVVSRTHQFYLQQQPETDAPFESPFGCFSYAVWSDNRIRIHFHNADNPPHRPLSQERKELRLSELRMMFADIRVKAPHATNVVGGSWLYSLEAYRRLFPPEFLHTAYRGDDDYPFMALWGQFLTWDGRIKNDLAQKFLDCLQQQDDLDGIKGYFPFPVLRLECAVGTFYDFYQIEPPV